VNCEPQSKAKGWGTEKRPLLLIEEYAITATLVCNIARSFYESQIEFIITASSSNAVKTASITIIICPTYLFYL